MESEATRRRAWIEGQLQPQPDGTFLARPSAWIGGVFALPDAATKDRYVAYCEREHGNAVVVLCVVLVIMLVGFVAPLAFWTAGELLEFGWALPGLFVAALVAPHVLGTLRHRAWLRRAGAVQVPRERWNSTLAQSIWSYYTDNELRGIIQRDIAGTIFILIFVVIYFVVTNSDLFDPVNVFLILLLVIFWLPAVGYVRELQRRRSARRRG